MPTPLTRTFRSGLSIGTNGEQRPVTSNFTNGIGRKDEYGPRATPANPKFTAPVVTGAAPATSRVAAGASSPQSDSVAGNTTYYQPITAGQMRERAAREARSGTPNKGGAMTRGGATTFVPPSPAAIRPQIGPAIPAAMPAPIQPALDTPGTPVAGPTTDNAQQTESANPLTGDGNAQAGGTTDEIDPGSALGLNRRGASTPSGSDAVADQNVGGSGLYARKFSNPRSASVYQEYVRKLFPS